MWILCICLLCCAPWAKASNLALEVPFSEAPLTYQFTVSGTVVDESGSPLPGANVVEQGTLNGTQSDFDGNFSLEVSNANAVLEVSYIGFDTQQVSLSGRSTLSVVLSESAEALAEVVVTALGIKTEKRALGYATAQVEGDDISGVKATNNFVNALSGKVAGVQISSTSSQPGSGTRIVIRGGSSITGNNQPLVVVNGVPFDASNSSTSSGLGDIDPNSIESLSVLKGASAAALYGSRAANGVLLITTKSGTFQSKPQITFTNSASLDHIYEVPLQKTWAQGSWDGTDWSYVDGETAFTSVNFGPRISDVPGARYYDRWEVFNTGFTNESSLSITGGAEKATYYVAYSNLMNDGILDPLNYRRHSLNANTSFKFTPKLTVSTNIMYSTQQNKRLDENSSNSSFMNTLLGTPNTWNPYPIYAEDGRLRSYRGGSRDPYLWLLDNAGNTNIRDRLAATVTLEYEIAPKINFRSVTGISTSSVHNESFYNKGGYASVQGSYDTQERFYRDLESTETLTYDDDFGDFDFTVMVGHNIVENRYRGLYYEGTGLILPGIYNTANVSGYESYEDKSLFRSYSFFGQALVGYKNFLYYTVTGRNDWASSVQESFFYPSHSLGFVFSELLPRSEVFNYGKLRASYAKVGAPASPYARNVVLADPASDGVLWPFNGRRSYLSSSKIPNLSLANEFKSEIEFGAELQFFQNRLGVDFSYYHNWSENQILREQFLPSTGYTYGDVNIGGITHKGMELALHATPVRTADFEWNLNLNWSKDKSMVDELGTNDEPIYLGSYGTAVVGQPYPVIYDIGFLRDDQGRLVLDDNPGSGYGRPLADNSKNQILGTSVPDWIGSFRTGFEYKNFSLSALLEMSKGGFVYSLNDHYLTYYGMAKHQENRPENNMITFDGVMGHYDSASGQVVVTSETPQPTRYDLYWQTVAQSVLEDNIMPRDYIKLREVSLGYEVPKTMLANVGLDGLHLAFSGRNLWRKFKDGFEGPDPEINTEGINNGNAYLGYSLPATKTYTLTLTAKF